MAMMAWQALRNADLREIVAELQRIATTAEVERAT